MKELFIPYEQAIILKELGFNEECLAFYLFEDINHLMINGEDDMYYDSSSTNLTLAPLYQQVFRWFREKFGLSSEIHLKMSNGKRKIWYNINELDSRLVKSMYFKNYPKGFFKTYEEAELACLKKLILIVKNK